MKNKLHKIVTNWCVILMGGVFLAVIAIVFGK